MDDRDWLREAVALARLCPVSDTAFSVGAVIVIDGALVATGYSRQYDPRDHAEEVALRAAEGRDLRRATIYSSLEPCGQRASRSATCAELIISAGIPRVVYAWREPDTFVTGRGRQWLSAAGVEVVQIAELAAEAAEPNAHLHKPARDGDEAQ